MKPVGKCEDCHRYAWNLISLDDLDTDEGFIMVCHDCLDSITRRSGGVMAIEMGGKVTIMLPPYQYELP